MLWSSAFFFILAPRNVCRECLFCLEHCSMLFGRFPSALIQFWLSIITALKRQGDQKIGGLSQVQGHLVSSQLWLHGKTLSKQINKQKVRECFIVCLASIFHSFHFFLAFLSPGLHRETLSQNKEGRMGRVSLYSSGDPELQQSYCSSFQNAGTEGIHHHAHLGTSLNLVIPGWLVLKKAPLGFSLRNLVQESDFWEERTLWSGDSLTEVTSSHWESSHPSHAIIFPFDQSISLGEHFVCWSPTWVVGQKTPRYLEAQWERVVRKGTFTFNTETLG